MKIRITGGMNINVPGSPRQVIREGAPLSSVALQGSDYPGIRPLLRVKIGDHVMAGQPLFVDRKRPDIQFTAPGSGMVTTIEYGRRRSLKSLIIQLKNYDSAMFDIQTNLERKNMQMLLLKSGMWPAFLTRPFGRIPDPFSVPDAIFVTAMDTNPLAADASIIVQQHIEHFRAGLELLTLLTDGMIFICQAPGSPLSGEDKDQLKCVEFAGRHPAGLPSTHIHRLFPVYGKRIVWHINYQDVIAIGALRTTGKYWSERIISLAGPGVQNPALVRTSLGANLNDLLAKELNKGNNRVVSGSLLSGRKAAFLGRYHTQISVLREAKKVSKPNWFTRLFYTPNNSSFSPLIPTDKLEQTMAINIAPVPLLRALSVGDKDTAKALGCRELVEEDIALLTYACASEVNYAQLLRTILNELEVNI